MHDEEEANPVFRKEHFKVLIQNTFDQWLGDDKNLSWSMADYMKVAMQLECRVSRYLTPQGNLLALDTMPFLDLGDKPSTYNPMISEAFQSFLEPKPEYPDCFYVHYRKRAFKTESLVKKFRRSTLERHSVDFLDFEQTIQVATKCLEPYRGVVARLERANLIVIIIGFVITVAASMLSGILQSWTYCLLYISLYFVAMAAVMVGIKIASNKYLRQAHFALALFCRSENNRFYLERRVELRPGFLGKWLQVIAHNPPDTAATDPQWLLTRLQSRYPDHFKRDEEQHDDS